MKKHSILLGIFLYLLSSLPASAITVPSLETTIGVGIMTIADMNTYADAVFNYNQSTGEYADYTADAKDIAASDVYFPDDGTMLYIGSNYKFDKIGFNINTAASTSSSSTKHFKLEYYNNGTWSSLDFDDSSSNFSDTGKQSISFDIPEAWDSSSYTQATVDNEKNFWIRIDANSSTSVSEVAEVSQIALRAYNFALIAETERGTDLNESLTEDDFAVSGGSGNTIEGFRDEDDGVYSLALHDNNSDNNYNVLVSPSNYVAQTITSGDLSDLSSRKTVTGDFQYTHVIQVKNSSGTYIIPDLVVANGVTCDIGAVFAYCALSITKDGTLASEDLVVTKSGYTTKSTVLAGQRDETGDSQIITSVTLTESSSSGGTDTPDEYATLSIDVQNEDGTALKGIDEDDFDISSGTDNEIYGYTNNNNGNYILSLNGSATDTSYSVRLEADGYVANTFSTESLEDDTTYKSLSMKFAYKVKVTGSNGTVITNATVKAGNSLGTLCYYIGSGYYGCAVPVSDTSTQFKVTASKYKTYYANFGSDRDDQTDSQLTSNAELTYDPTGCYSPFDDISGHWAESVIESLYCRGIVSGRSDYRFEPDSTITRAEFLKIALLNAGYSPSGYNGETFNDVYSSDWYYSYISLAEDHDFINGYEDGSFKPNNSINRAEALTILIRIAGQTLYGFDSSDLPFWDVSVDDWYAYATIIAYQDDIVDGYSDGSFRPENDITRAEVVMMSANAEDAYYD